MNVLMIAYFFFFVLSLQSECILHWEHIPGCTGYLSHAQLPHVDSGYCIGQHRSRLSLRRKVQNALVVSSSAISHTAEWDPGQVWAIIRQTPNPLLIQKPTSCVILDLLFNHLDFLMYNLGVLLCPLSQFLWGLNEIIFVNHLVKWLACDNNLINSNYCLLYRVSSYFKALTLSHSPLVSNTSQFWLCIWLGFGTGVDRCILPDSTHVWSVFSHGYTLTALCGQDKEPL